MKINVHWFTYLLVIACIMSFAGFSTAFADSHEADEESQMEHEEAAAAEEESSIPGWFRVDTDSLGTNFLIGATHVVGGIPLASTIYIGGTSGEYDFGVVLPVVKGDSMSLTLLPTLGVGFDYSGANGPSTLFPQMFVFLPAGKFYFQSWTIATLFLPSYSEDATNTVYTRNRLTYKINDTVDLGPQFETVLGLVDGVTPFSTIIGLRVNIAYGENNTLGVLVGYDLEKGEDDTGLTGRLSFTRSW